MSMSECERGIQLYEREIPDPVVITDTVVITFLTAEYILYTLRC